MPSLGVKNRRELDELKFIYYLKLKKEWILGYLIFSDFMASKLAFND